MGHLALASDALRELGLQRVALVPAHSPPHKPERDDPGPSLRLRMCELLSAGREEVSACAIEIERRGVSYTVDTLEQIHARHPQAELTLIAGADIAATLPSWREPARVLELAGLAVAAREGVQREQVLAAVQAARADGPPERGPAPAGGASEVRVRFLRMPLVAISSSLVRQRAAEDEPLQGLVGEAVASYIRERRLYRAPALERS